MKVPKKQMKEIMKSDTASFRVKMDRAVKSCSTYFVDNYWSEMTEKKSVRNLEFESKVIRILDLNCIDVWEDKQKALHTLHSYFNNTAVCCEYLKEDFDKKIQKDYPELSFVVKGSSIKIVDNDGAVFFKAKCKSSYSQIWDQFNYNIYIESAKFTYGSYFKDKENEKETEQDYEDDIER